MRSRCHFDSKEALYLDCQRQLHALFNGYSAARAVILPMRQQPPEEVHRILGVLARSLFRAYATADDLLKLTRSL